MTDQRQTALPPGIKLPLDVDCAWPWEGKLEVILPPVLSVVVGVDRISIPLMVVRLAPLMLLP